MKRKILQALPILLALLAGCQTSDSVETPSDSSVTLRVEMPEQIKMKDGSVKASFYWNKEHTLAFTIKQGSEVVLSQIKSPSEISADGRIATFTIPLKQHSTTGLTISGNVVSAPESLSKVPMKSIYIDPAYEQSETALTYDVLDKLPIHLALPGTELSSIPKEGTIRLETTGSLFAVKLFNRAGQEVHPQSFYIEGQSPTFVTSSTRYDRASGRYEGGIASTTDTLALRDLALPKEGTKQFVLWVPETQSDGAASSIARLTYKKGSEDAIYTAKSDSTVTGAALPDKGTMNLTLSMYGGRNERPSDEEVDVSNGGDPKFRFEDIKYWVGKGSNQAAMVIEWHDGKHPDAFVWGYRWDGEKTGFDMLTDITRADPRLTTLFCQWSDFGIAVIAIAYQFEPTTPRAPLLYKGKEIANASNGLVNIGNTHEDKNYGFSDPKAHWQCGYNFDTPGYWSYFVKDDRADSWNYSQLMSSNRILVDKCWDGWSFQIGWDQWEGNPHGNKFIAVEPPTK